MWMCGKVCAPRSLEPPWELGVLELEELPLLVLFRGVSMETSVLRRSGLLQQHKHNTGSFIQETNCHTNIPAPHVCVSVCAPACVYLARMRCAPARGPRPGPFPGEFFLPKAGEMDVVLWGTCGSQTHGGQDLRQTWTSVLQFDRLVGHR